MKKKNGFTLVELLAVIVILGILIAIAVPSVLTISKKIKANMYDNKLKTISAAVSLWADDNKRICSSYIEDLTVEDLINGSIVQNFKGNYIKSDEDNKTTVLNNEGEELVNKKVSELKDSEGNLLFDNIIDLCGNVYIASLANFSASNEQINQTQEQLSNYSSQMQQEKPQLSSYCKEGSYYNARCLANQGSIDSNKFSNLPDKSTIDDYRLNSNYVIHRYKYVYRIDLTKNGQKYLTKDVIIDKDKGSQTIKSISIPKGYKYSTTTCPNLIYDSSIKGFKTSTSSNELRKNYECKINFVTDIASPSDFATSQG